MPNILNMVGSGFKVMESLIDDKKSPLHVGEVMSCWTYLAFVSSIVTYEQVALNTVQDDDLKGFLKKALKTAKDHKNKLTDFMTAEGVQLPPMPEEKPKESIAPSQIPFGARFTDEEMANTLVINFIMAADLCATAASQSLRADVGLFFLGFQTDKLTLGLKAKTMMQKKGWLKIPPFYSSTGSLPS